MVAALQPFLTAFDPPDLPGGSIDPLGFDRGYLFLADKLLPGLTNVANRPRYFGVLCAGSLLAGEVADTPREQRRARTECVLRLERFWVLANVLATEEAGDDALPTLGLRGVTYGRRVAQALVERGASTTDATYDLLPPQAPNGMVGIYGAVAAGMTMWDRKTLSLSEDLGAPLAEAFLDASRTPRSLRKAVKTGGTVSLRDLREWGAHAHLAGSFSTKERQLLGDALQQDSVRLRFCEVLEEHPYYDAETEQQRLARILPVLDHQHTRDLHDAVAAVLAYERAYELVQLGFERLIFLCRHAAGGICGRAEIRDDAVLRHVCEGISAAVAELEVAVDQSRDIDPHLRGGIHKLDDVRSFLRSLRDCQGPVSLAHELIGRHTSVQAGKFDRGRSKMPWIEHRDDGWCLSLAKVGGVADDPASVDDIVNHPYRLHAADALIEACSPDE